MVKWILIVLGVIVFFAVGGSAVVAKAPEARERVTGIIRGDEDGEGQGAAQISSTEYVGLRRSATSASVRSRIGEPEKKHTATVEGVKVECWYYGIVAATGSYQLCFVSGKLSSRSRYAPSG